jgi:hypothetical protein
MEPWPRWAVMWALALVVYATCKFVTWRHAREVRAPWWRHAGYLLLWPGMDAAAFLTRSAAPPRPLDWLSAVLATAVGFATLRVAVAMAALPGRNWIAGAIGMAAVVLTLHFGLFQLLSCAWRRAGVEAAPVMRTPCRATSLAEFWGRRWNTAFRDLTHAGLFVPLRSRVGGGPALLLAFLCSGVVHDAVVSLPAGGGYGGPTAYFTLHGLALLGERSRAGRHLGLGRGATGWTFTMAALLVPLGWLFHRPFLEGVIAPFFAALGRLS